MKKNNKKYSYFQTSNKESKNRKLSNQDFTLKKFSLKFGSMADLVVQNCYILRLNNINAEINFCDSNLRDSTLACSNDQNLKKIVVSNKQLKCSLFLGTFNYRHSLP
jgi:hypothetical protein